MKKLFLIALILISGMAFGQVEKKDTAMTGAEYNAMIQNKKEVDFTLAILRLYSEFVQDSVLVFTGSMSITIVDTISVQDRLFKTRSDSVYQWWHYRDNPTLPNFIDWLNIKLNKAVEESVKIMQNE